MQKFLDASTFGLSLVSTMSSQRFQYLQVCTRIFVTNEELREHPYSCMMKLS
jgi:hypothetical protein